MDIHGRWKDWEGLGHFGAGPFQTFCVKPGTYMNDSGRMVESFARSRGIAPAEILVCFDDMALPLGRLRLRLSGSSGGHNGMESVLEHLKTKQVPRLRIGIGPLPPGLDPVEFVLGSFKKEEAKALDAALDLAEEAAQTAVSDGIAVAMNKFNSYDAGT